MPTIRIQVSNRCNRLLENSRISRCRRFFAFLRGVRREGIETKYLTDEQQSRNQKALQSKGQHVFWRLTSLLARPIFRFINIILARNFVIHPKSIAARCAKIFQQPVWEQLRDRAKSLGRSLGGHVRQILAQETFHQVVLPHQDGFTNRRRQRERHPKKDSRPLSPTLWIPLTIQRGERDLDVEVEVIDFYIRRQRRQNGSHRLANAFYADDDPNEAQFSREAIIQKTGEKIELTEEEIARAEEKFWRQMFSKKAVFEWE